MTRTEKIAKRVADFLMKVYAWYIYDSRKHYYHRWEAWGKKSDFTKYLYYLKKSLHLKAKGL
jgi:hypothetical protein